ncbi:hypothetical protein RQP46_008690 [Phenoliferia psychrophenolica]
MADPPAKKPSSSSSSSKPAFSVAIPPRAPGAASSRPEGPLPTPAAESDTDELAMETSTSKPASKSQKEGVFKILKRQANEGLETQYIVMLVEDGKKRDESQLKELAPNLLAAFLAENAPPVPVTAVDTSEIVLESDSDAEPAVPAAKFKPSRSTATRKEKTAPASDEDDGTEDEDEEDEDDDGASGDDASEGDESSQSGEESSEEDLDASDDFADEDGGARRPRRATKSKSAVVKVKSPKKGVRASTRSTRHQKTFDLGGGEMDVDEEADLSQSEDEGGHSRRATRARPSVSGDDFSDSEMRWAKKESRRQQQADEMELDSDSEYEHGESSLIQHTHYAECGKCGDGPVTEILARITNRRKNRRGKKKARKNDDLKEDSDQEEERVRKLGAWLECKVCTSPFHYGCLQESNRKAFSRSLQAAHDALHAPPPAPPVVAPLDGEPAPEPAPAAPIPKRERRELDIRAKLPVLKCGFCEKVGGRRCFICGVSGRKANDPAPAAPAPVIEAPPPAAAAADADAMDADPVVAADNVKLAEDTLAEDTLAADKVAADKAKAIAEIPALMFRCMKCKRASHYTCMPIDESLLEEPAEAHIESYLADKQCHQCWSFKGTLDVILAWSVDEALAQQMLAADVDPDDVRVVVEQTLKKDDQTGRMVAIPSAKDPTATASYLVKWQGESYRRLEWVPHAYLVAAYQAKLSNFLARGSTVTFDSKPEDDEKEDGEEDRPAATGSAPLPDAAAEDRIPIAWKTVDRVLDVNYRSRNGRTTVRHANYRDLPADPAESIELIDDCYIKWGDLPYSSSTWEAPPGKNDPGYDAFVKAYGRFLTASHPSMRVPNPTPKQFLELDKPRNHKKFQAIATQPSYIEGGKLMPFQLEGVNFMYYQWWKRTGCILADEMGLGKTVQIITFLSVLSQKEGARPFLVAVPNSTMGNWVREFERWAPSMRVVPYGGDAPSRRIVEEFELFDDLGKALKTHVVVATYEALEKNINVFKRVARWDCLVVDEGQRLKSGMGGLLFSALRSLNVNHRVLLSGTPLNNNITELFNLLHFIDPDQWGNSAELQEEYSDLTKEKVEKIRGILKPYFLRRTKELVLDLPPLNEIIVPVTMTPLQRQLYKSILERNAAALESIYQKTSKSMAKNKSRKTSFNNILMELRKLLGHPYLVSPDLEPVGVTPAQAHLNLRDASAKFILLSMMLPKLKEGGHRVLIFSQFKLTLNVLEDFLRGLNMKYLRLDGDTVQLDRQRGIDAYQKEGSDVFCYLLSTRAGGVGINLTKADTVIMFDQDFNPHQDIQAISRAHRIGQVNPVRVFKLMVKGTCEERIFQAGTKKLGLDHLIIQRLDAQEEEANEVESVLQYGAKAIFDDQEAEATAIRVTDAMIENLLTRTSGIMPPSPKKDGAASFAHAKIWAESGDLEDVVVGSDDEIAPGDGDFWSNMLHQQEAADREAKQTTEANAGRGKRNRREVVYTIDRRRKAEAAEESGDDSDDNFVEAEGDESGDDYDIGELDKEDMPTSGKQKRQKLSHGLAHSTVPLTPEELARRSEAKRAKRVQNIDSLARAAAVYNDDDVNLLLAMARGAERVEQTRLLKKATRQIYALCSKPYDGPLNSIANQGSSTSSKARKLSPL